MCGNRKTVRRGGKGTKRGMVERGAQAVLLTKGWINNLGGGRDHSNGEESQGGLDVEFLFQG